MYIADKCKQNATSHHKMFGAKAKTMGRAQVSIFFVANFTQKP